MHLCVLKHPDADTMLLSIYAKLSMDNVSDIVVLDSEDTDVYAQAAYVSRQVRGDLMIKRKNNYIDCCSMLTENVAEITIPLHVISGSDHTSSFYGRGEKKMPKKVVSDHEAKAMLSRVDENLELKDKVKVDMQSFVLSKLYSDSGDLTRGQAKASKWQKTKRENTICLPR